VRGAIALAFAGLVACGPAQPASTTTTPAAPAPTLDQMVDAMCACKTPACVDGVKTQYPGLDKPADTTPHVMALHDALAACEATAREGDEVGTFAKMDDAMCACKDAPCAERVQHDYKEFWKREIEKYSGNKKPTAQVEKIAEHIGDCEMRAREGVATTGHGTGLDHTGGDWHPAPDPDATGDSETSIPECDAYLVAFDKYMSCDKIPQATKDATREGIAAQKVSFRELKDAPPEAKKAAADGCRQGLDALKQAADALGCPL
jgi:hypothetical protein